jgi:hypothetical protein
MRKLIILCSLYALAACGGITQIDENQQAITEAKLPAIDPAGGQLCVCRASNYVGGGAILGLKANGEYIGDVPNGSYLCANLSPDEYSITGDCTLCSRVGAETLIKQGQRKYMELYVGMNGMNLHSTSREIGLSCIADAMK